MHADIARPGVPLSRVSHADSVMPSVSVPRGAPAIAVRPGNNGPKVPGSRVPRGVRWRWLRSKPAEVDEISPAFRWARPVRGARAARVGVGGGVRAFFFHDTATTEIYTLSLHDP